MRKNLLAVSLLLLGGCVSGSDMDRLEMQLNDLQDEIAQLKQQASSKEDLQKLNTTLATQSDRIVKTNADLSVKVGDLDDKVQNVQGSVEQTNHRVDRLAEQITRLERDVADLQGAALRGTAVNPGTVAVPGSEMVVTPTTPTEDPLAMYQASYRDYQKGNYDLAIEGFRDFLSKNPSSDLADNATYWIAESLFSQKKYQPAIDQFNTVISKYPKSDKVPASLLKKGYAYIEIGEKAQGAVQLQYVIHEHPRSQEASLARQKLKALGIESK